MKWQKKCQLVAFFCFFVKIGKNEIKTQVNYLYLVPRLLSDKNDKNEIKDECIIGLDVIGLDARNEVAYTYDIKNCQKQQQQQTLTTTT